MKTTKPLLPLILLFAVVCMQAHAASFTVTSNTDSNTPGSLRWAIDQANFSPGADMININAYGNISTHNILINDDVTIQGPGAGILSINGNSIFSNIFTIISCNVTISGLSIINFHLIAITYQGDSTKTLNIFNCAFLDNGKAIYSLSGAVHIDRCTFAGNNEGALIMNQASGTITNSTFSGNGSSTSDFGAIFYTASTDLNHPTSLSIFNATISGNTSEISGAGIKTTFGVVLCNTIVAGNSAPNGPDVFGNFTSLGYNFIGKSDGSTGFTNAVNNDQVGTIASPIDPMLGALAYNGGPTKTMALTCGSSAINAAHPDSIGNDQRYFAMVAGRRDIGAFELQPSSLVVTSTADSGPGTLRNALANACYGDVITFSVTGVITVTSELDISKTVTIQGPGADVLSISGGNSTRIFHDGDTRINNVVISGLEIKNGNTVSYGSAIFVWSAHLAIRNCDINNNSTAAAGTITLLSLTPGSSSLTIENSSIHHNSSSDYASGIFLPDAASLSISNSTFFANSCANTGQAIKADGSTIVLTNVTMAGNSGGTTGVIDLSLYTSPQTTIDASISMRNCIFDNPISNYYTSPTTIETSYGHNISNDNSMYNFLIAAGDLNNTSSLLDPAGLQDNGGTTPTVALQCNSPALNATTNYFNIDQIGNVRGAVADIGAFESSIQPSAVSISGNLSFCAGNSTTLNAGTFLSYNWSTGATTQTISVNTAATFTVSVTNANGCTGSASVTTTVNPTPSCTISGSSTICAGASTQWCAPNGLLYNWSNGATTQCITRSATGNYSVTTTDVKGCSSSCNKQLTVGSQLTIDAGLNKVVYKGYPDSACATLTATGAGGGNPPYTYTWTGGSHATTISVCPTTSTTYYLTITDANNCSFRDSVHVCVLDVRCGNGNKKVTVCHGTGSVNNPFITLCILPADAKWHFLNHPGEKLGTCGMVKTCGFGTQRWGEEEMTEGIEEDISLMAYPNPASGEINIAFHSEEDGKYLLRLVDITGQILLSETKDVSAGENKYTVNLQNLAPGIYTVLLQSGDNLVQTRIVKE